jgi:formate dehydrogenase subunit delta
VTGLPPEIRMGNDIARAFAHLPQEEAVAAIGAHLKRFWDPRMRHAIVARVDEGHPDLNPLLAQAVRESLASVN